MSPVRRAPHQLTHTQSTLRRDYLDQVVDLLWPAPATVAVGRPGPGSAPVVSEFVVVPSLARPHLLVPLHARRAAATALRRYSEPRTRLAKYRLEVLARAMRTGLGELVMRDRVRVEAADGSPAGIEAHLTEVLGRRVQLSLHIGPARANRKPVLQLLSEDGDVIGFVKIGVNDLTRRLVVAEAGSLAHLAGSSFGITAVPRLLHSGVWRGLQVLVQSPLPIWEKRAPLPPERLAQSMLEVAAVDGVTTERLVDTPYWDRLRTALDELTPTDPVEQLRTAFAALDQRAQDAEVPMGAWHGDWTPWNMASLPHRVLVWDWERFERGVPLGFDALHYDLQRAVVRKGADPRLAVARCLAQSADLLAPFGVEPRYADVVALTYLVDLAVRYLTDGQAEAGARLGVLGQWLLPELVERVTTP
ncbi:hypothetical protein SAMN05661080_01486 [Modestobacter sp. DSM 44400]|uniref:hypothetical protein n=1 Tax=Modestobacter sp. DSM 44400 TaxID=1550230 RepID=UPI00089A4784|nr:hypothetical protein [Modestobacter sp. DSM 44400]SDX86531.1 hypothetical protein SAMN05661080_01486 [Modestobacter sp. DSM 44400]